MQFTTLQKSLINIVKANFQYGFESDQYPLESAILKIMYAILLQ